MATQHETGKNKTATTPTPLRRRSNLRPVLTVYWSSIEATSIRGALDAVTRAGGAIMFGRTSDGGALSICILDRDQKIKEYPHTSEEAEEVLAAILEEYVGI